MKADRLTAGQLFDSTRKFVAPLFQRPYVWRQEKNWEPLWDYIVEIAEHRLNNTRGRPHFLGAIVLEPSRKTGVVDTREIIDGQQRLTTLQLAIAAFRDLAAEREATKLQDAWVRLSLNHVPLSHNEDDIFKVWPTNVDRPAFRNVLLAGSATAVAKLTAQSDQLIPRSYQYFRDAAREWIGSGSEFEQRMEALYYALRDDTQIVVIDLEQDDDAQVIFQTLNALGTPLLTADLIKNHLLHAVEMAGRNAETVYERYWKDIDYKGAYWRQEVRQGRLTRPRIDIFLQHYLALKTGSITEAGQHLYGEFKEFVARNPAIPAEQHMEMIRRYSDIYHDFDSYPRGSREEEFFYRLEQLDTTTVLPVLLGAFAELERDDELSIVADLESYLVRRTVCGLTTKAYNRVFADLLAKLAGGITPEGVREFLLEQSADSSRWPSDEEFRRAWLQTPLYTRIVRKRLRMILEALEMELRTSKAEGTLLERSLTVEHVMPQSWRANWPIAAGEDPERLTDECQRLVHTIGNLTLVNGKLNPALSNGSWVQKRGELQRHTGLAMNREILQIEDWNEHEIRQRSVALFEVALRLWTRPNNPVAEELPAARREERAPAMRHLLRWRFWEQLLTRAHEAGVALHANRAPSDDAWLSAGGAGRSGFSWTYLIWMEDKSGIELSFGNTDARVNKAAFDYLHARKPEIESAFGSELEWERLDEKNSSRVRKLYHGAGLIDENRWPEIQDRMIDAMHRFHEAVQPHLEFFSSIESDGQSTLKTSGPMMVECLLDGEVITIETALDLRNRAGGSAALDLTCIECGQPVRPHAAGGEMSAHFEHLSRNPACSRSHRLKTTT